ncbi:MAG TPA: nitroreductase/quinone reductase family protein [Dehalococcoidia bacterium]|jgi:deazaflavin-dependent oxidoreductase (nitroreductase family)
MNEQIREALARDRTIDITTTGRRSGRPRRLEIWFHNLDGAIYITGLPGRRSWYANLLAQPAFTFHLKGSVNADLPAHARAITDPQERRTILTRILARLDRSQELEQWLARSPLVAVTFDE